MKKITSLLVLVVLLTSLSSIVFAENVKLESSNLESTDIKNQVSSELKEIKTNLDTTALTASPKLRSNKQYTYGEVIEQIERIKDLGQKYQDEIQELPQEEQVEILDSLGQAQLELNAVFQKGVVVEEDKVATVAPVIGVQTTSAVRKDWTNRRGNMLYTNAQAKDVAGLTYPYGHVALVSKNKNAVIEAVGKGVKHRVYTTMWTSKTTKGLCDELYVRGATWAKYDSAIAFALKQENKPYKWKTSLSANNEWYCSKLVWRAYKEAGMGELGEPYLGYIPPSNIYWEDRMVLQYKWGTGNIGSLSI